MVSLCAFALAFGLPAPASAGLQGDQEIAALNGQRSMNGIPGDLTEEVSWSQGCANHMAYLEFNNEFDHVENPAKPGYTAEGQAAGTSGVLTSGGGSFSANGANAFQQAPIHLTQMLNPFMRRSGAAEGCLATLRDIDRVFPATTTFSYPGNGGVAVTGETAFEGPFVPGDFVGLPQGTRTGPHLYFYAAKAGDNGQYHSKGTITSGTLTGPGGVAVDVRTVDNHTIGGPGPVAGQNLGQYLSSGGMLIPAAPLTEGASYTASVSFTFDSGGTVQRTWSFTAVSTLPLPAVPASTRPPILKPVITVPTPVAAPTPTPTAAPAPTAPTRTPGGVGPGLPGTPTPALSNVVLKRKALTLTATVSATLSVTIEQKKVTKKAGKKRTTYVPRRTFEVTTKAGQATTVKVKTLAKGSYRLTVRTAGAKGPVAFQRTLTVK